MSTNNNAGSEHGTQNSGNMGAGKAGNKNIMAVFAYLWVLIIIPFLTDAKDDPFVKFHLKQGLALIIFDVIGWFVNFILAFVPVVGWLIMMLWWIASVVFAIMGIMNVLNNQEKELPVIGQYTKSFTF